MPKDTKSSGYNKAPACESRGFGHKKEGENFDTPSFYFLFLLFQYPLCTVREHYDRPGNDCRIFYY